MKSGTVRERRGAEKMTLKIKRRSFRTHFVCKSETNVQQKGALGQLKQRIIVNKPEEAEASGTVGGINGAKEKDGRELLAGGGSSW